MLPTSLATPKADALIDLPGKPGPKRASGRRIHLNTDQRTVITLHHHEVIIRRTDPFYKVVSVLESVFLVTSSFSLIAASGAMIVWAASIVEVI